MRQLPRLHLLLFVLTWALAVVWGTTGVLVMTGVLLAVELVVWRADLVRLPSARRVWARRTTRRHPVPSFEGVRHAVRLGAHSRREFDFGIRRRLERVASTRLADGHGVDPHRDPARARELLGEQAWELLDPGRPISTERSRAGVPEATLAQVVDRLERL